MSVKLFVLGVLNKQDAHGYEIRELAKEWGLEYWSAINYSSIYHALEKLEEATYIVKIHLEHEGNRPEKTVYRITNKGKESFRILLHDAFSDIDMHREPINLALAFIKELAVDERLIFLTDRKKNLEALIFGIHQKLNYLQKNIEKYQWAVASVKLSLKLKEAELEWLQALINEIPTW